MSDSASGLEIAATQEYAATNPLSTRYYTKSGQNVYDSFEYEKRTAQVRNSKGGVLFEQQDVEVPKGWSDSAVNILASKYFRKKGVSEEDGGTKTGGEQSIKRVVHRIAHTIRTSGEKMNYFASGEEAGIFEDELSYILLSQTALFNSPVLFNLGLSHDYGIVKPGGLYYWDEETKTVKLSGDAYSHPQVSACFINSVGDYMFGDHGEDDHSIYTLIETESKLFKFGSGTGSNYSAIRGVGEPLSSGGESSGLMTFLKIPDAGANAVKSGGTTRRAAKMDVLDADHPEIKDFAYWKVDGERKARALAGFGYDTDIDGLYKELSGQNSNNTVSLTDAFMNAVENDENWNLIERTTGNIKTTVKARELFEYFAKAAWVSGDPGVHFNTTINNWHTCPADGEIRASNPCSEYLFLDDSACNLASMNLMKFRRTDGSFDVQGLRHTSRTVFTAQEIMVDLAGYPTPSIARKSHNFRTIGLGHVNIGTYLMSIGVPYDSNEGRAIAASITSIMTGEAYNQSAKIASRMGSYAGFEKNRDSHIRVMRQHQENHEEILTLNPVLNPKINLEEMLKAGKEIWEDVVTHTEKYGSRNAQATVEAPTGTIGFVMDCDTLGVEPDFALVKIKNFVGGGYTTIVNKTVPMALAKLGYNEMQIGDITNYVINKGTIEGAPYLKEQDLAVFDCANEGAGKRAISPEGHVDMVAAIQPFISGSISKTVNMPATWTPLNVRDIYMRGWKKQVKAMALYRDGAKLAQPLSTKKSGLEQTLKRGEDRPLPQNADSLTIRLKIKDELGIEEGLHIICGEYEDGTLGEVRAQIFREGGRQSRDY